MSKNRGQSQSRQEKRQSKLGREFSNKKGVQMIVTPFYNMLTGRTSFTKITKRLQHLDGKTIVHLKYD